MSTGSTTGNESVIAQDTTWKYGVEQKLGLGIAVDVISLALGASGVAAVLSKTAARKLATTIGGYLFTNIFGKHLSRIVNIELNRYILRGADGKKRYQVYATYYSLDGHVLDACLVQQGIA